ncbi:hypothetical protein G6F42_019317 [Rhizopus arrhizus]|nr:hypothetical protein G6F42_019317 [Rhizopus arrhizus]
MPHQPQSPKFATIYLYIPDRLAPKDQRSTIRRLGVDTDQVLDIHYPGVNTVALLVRASIYARLHSIFGAHPSTNLQDSFNPLDPDNLGSREFRSAPKANRIAEIKRICTVQKLKALDHLHLPLRLEVAQYFAQQGWISAAEHTAVIQQTEQTRLDPANVFGRRV